MSSKNSCFERIVQENIGNLYSSKFYSSKTGKNYRIQTEFTDSVSSLCVESKENEIYHQDGILYDIYTEEKSLKMITVIRDENYEIIGAGLLANNTDYGFLTIDDMNYFGVYHIYISEEHRGASLSKYLIRDSLKILEEKFMNFSEDPPMIAIQKHVHMMYRNISDTIIIPYNWADMDFNYQE